MNKKFLKYLFVFFILATGTIIFIYAQKGFLFKRVTKEIAEQTNKEDQGEDIGQLTNDDPWNEMDKIVAANSSAEGIFFKGIVKLVDDNGDKEKILEEQNFEYSFVGRNMYQKLGNMEFINKPELLLVADHSNKIIAVASGQQENKTTRFFDIKEFKKVMEKTKAEAKVTQTGDQKLLSIENIDDAQIQGYRIYYNPSTYAINKILIGMLRLSPLDNEQEGIQDAIPNSEKKENEDTGAENNDEVEAFTYYLEIIYSEMKVMGIKEGSFHPENKFITRTKDKSGNYRVGLNAAFKNYHLMNNGVDESENDKPGEPQQ
jgi:hypothetical protein